MGSEVSFGRRLKRKLKIRSQITREFLAEFLGTFILILVGDGSVAQYVLFEDNLGTYLSVNWAWGIAVALGVWISGGITGGHINPAMSVAMTVLGRLSIMKCFIYMAAQYLGAIIASSVVYGVYLDALNNFENGTSRTMETAGVWATYPQDFVLWSTGLADQIVGTAILAMCVMAITDKNNLTPPKGMVPFCVGLIVAAIGMSFGSNCGYAINPARDLGPRIFTAMAGWGEEPFSFRDSNWFWVPVVGPHIGAILGAWIYLLCVGIHAEPDEDDEDDDKYEMNQHDNPGFDDSVVKNGANGSTDSIKINSYM